MSITVNGQSRVPPGFRFHPTEEELLSYYLRKKVACEKIDLDVIRDVDINKLEPWDIQEKCRIGSTPQNDWYFFSHKDKKYPTGTRTNRATAAGFWKATGRDKVIYSSSKRIGMRKTLVFYRGRAPHGQKSDWIMHEYRLDDHTDANSQANASRSMGETLTQEEGWVVCRVFKKKSHHKAIDSPTNSSTITNDIKTQVLHSSTDGALDQILQYMGRSCKQGSDNQEVVGSNPGTFQRRGSCKQESDAIKGAINLTSSPTSNSSNSSLRYLLPIETTVGSVLHERFMKLPALESPTIPSLPIDYPALPDPGCGGQTSYPSEAIHAAMGNDMEYPSEPVPGISDWATLDRLVASHLNCQTEAPKQLAAFDEPGFGYCPSAARLLTASQDFHHHHHSGSSDGDLWSFTRSAFSSSDNVGHMSHSPI